MSKKPATKTLIELAQKYAGCTNDIATALGVNRGSILNWRKKDKEFDEEMKKGNQVLLELAKEGLLWHLQQKSEKTILYTLDRLGRQDGFGMMLQVQDKSKIDNQLDDMTEAEILALMEKTTNKIKKGQ